MVCATWSFGSLRLLFPSIQSPHVLIGLLKMDVPLPQLNLQVFAQEIPDDKFASRFLDLLLIDDVLQVIIYVGTSKAAEHAIRTAAKFLKIDTSRTDVWGFTRHQLLDIVAELALVTESATGAPQEV